MPTTHKKHWALQETKTVNSMGLESLERKGVWSQGCMLLDAGRSFDCGSAVVFGFEPQEMLHFCKDAQGKQENCKTSEKDGSRNQDIGNTYLP